MPLMGDVDDATRISDGIAVITVAEAGKLRDHAMHSVVVSRSAVWDCLRIIFDFVRTMLMTSNSYVTQAVCFYRMH